MTRPSRFQLIALALGMAMVAATSGLLIANLTASPAPTASPSVGAGAKNRLEAQVIGRGPAWIATNGLTIKGTWRKTSLTSPTTFHDGAGNPVTLTVGQTFIEVLQSSTSIRIADGAAPPAPPSPVDVPDGPRRAD